MDGDKPASRESSMEATPGSAASAPRRVASAPTAILAASTTNCAGADPTKGVGEEAALAGNSAAEEVTPPEGRLQASSPTPPLGDESILMESQITKIFIK